MQRRHLIKFLKGARMDGEGGKERIAAITDMTDGTIGALYALWEVQYDAYGHIFPTMTAGHNLRFYVDGAMHAETIVRVVGEQWPSTSGVSVCRRTIC